MSERYLVVTFTCPKCQKQVTIYEFDAVELARHFDETGTKRSRSAVRCAVCSRDYTLIVSGPPNALQAELEEDPSVEVVMHSADEHALRQLDYSEYIQDYMPADPEEAYYHSLTQLEDLVFRFQPKETDKTFYRMLFVQYVVVMEAYLADRLIKAVADVPAILKSFTTGHPTFAIRKYPIQALAARPNLLLEESQAFLKSQLFHDMEEVDKLYRAALGQTPFCDDINKAFLSEMAIRRHHCVHRNGKDNDGQILEGIGPHYIAYVSSHITAMVANIEEQIKESIS